MSKNTNVQCPKCQEVFKVDDTVYTDIVKQVRDQQFQDDLNSRLDAVEKEKRAALQLNESELRNRFQQQLAQKEQELSTIKLKSSADLAKEAAQKDAQINVLQSKIATAETEKKLALSEAVHAVEKQRDQLVNDLKKRQKR